MSLPDTKKKALGCLLVLKNTTFVYLRINCDDSEVIAGAMYRCTIVRLVF